MEVFNVAVVISPLPLSPHSDEHTGVGFDDPLSLVDFYCWEFVGWVGEGDDLFFQVDAVVQRLPVGACPDWVSAAEPGDPSTRVGYL